MGSHVTKAKLVSTKGRLLISRHFTTTMFSLEAGTNARREGDPLADAARRRSTFYPLFFFLPRKVLEERDKKHPVLHIEKEESERQNRPSLLAAAAGNGKCKHLEANGVLVAISGLQIHFCCRKNKTRREGNEMSTVSRLTD